MNLGVAVKVFWRCEGHNQLTLTEGPHPRSSVWV